MLPHSVFVLSLATVLFNQLSRSQATGDLDAVRGTINSGLRTIGVATMFGAAVLVVLAGPLARRYMAASPEAAQAWAAAAQQSALAGWGAGQAAGGAAARASQSAAGSLAGRNDSGMLPPEYR